MFTIQKHRLLNHDIWLKTKVILSALAVLLIVSSFSGTARADAVTRWNEIATTTFTADPTINFNPLAESRIYAMTHAAIHDALNAIDPRYKPYALYRRLDLGASPEAAVAAAA